MKMKPKKNWKNWPSHFFFLACFVYHRGSLFGLHKKKRGKGRRFSCPDFFSSSLRFFFLLQYGVRDIAGRFRKGKKEARRGSVLNWKKARFNFALRPSGERDCIEMTSTLFGSRLDPFRALSCSPVCVRDQECACSCTFVDGGGEDEGVV